MKEYKGDYIMTTINYKSHKGTTDNQTLENIISDIEYLRTHGTSPWTGASGRRNMDKRFTYKETLSVAGKEIMVDLSTFASCNYVRFGVVVTIDGDTKRMYLKELKKLVA